MTSLGDTIKVWRESAPTTDDVPDNQREGSTHINTAHFVNKDLVPTDDEQRVSVIHIHSDIYQTHERKYAHEESPNTNSLVAAHREMFERVARDMDTHPVYKHKFNRDPLKNVNCEADLATLRVGQVDISKEVIEIYAYLTGILD